MAVSLSFKRCAHAHTLRPGVYLTQAFRLVCIKRNSLIHLACHLRSNNFLKVPSGSAVLHAFGGWM